MAAITATSVDRQHVEGVVEMVLDATANCHAPVPRERLFGWHAALFPTGYYGLSKIKVGGSRAVDQAQLTLDSALNKARFWRRWATTPLSERQVKLPNRLLDGYGGTFTSIKRAAAAKCSPDTAPRDIDDPLAQGVLRKSHAGGRNTGYELNDLPGFRYGWWDDAPHPATIESTESKRSGLLQTAANSIEKPAGTPFCSGRSRRFFHPVWWPKRLLNLVCFRRAVQF